MLKIICIEEHANDAGIATAALPGMMQEAPCMALCQTERVAPAQPYPNRPGQVPMKQAVPLANEIGEVRLRAMDEQAIAMQVISLGHWGEMVPFYLARLDDVLPKTVTGLSRTISETYRAQVWVTPSGMFDLAHFKFIHEVLGADRIVWSNDYPYLTLDGTRAFLEALPVSDDDREKIAFRNAEELLRLTGEGSGSA